MSAVAICNTALAHLGHAARITSVSPPDGSREADLCAQLYPEALSALYESDYPWSWTVRTALLVPVLGEDVAAWRFAYLRPLDARTVFQVAPEGAVTSYRSDPYAIEKGSSGDLLIRADTPEAWARFTVSESNTALFSASFRFALSLLLASLLAGPLVKGAAAIRVAEALNRRAVQAVAAARAHDANRASSQPDSLRDFEPESFGARS